MSKHHFVAGAFTGAGALFFIGAAAAVAPAPEVQTTQAPPTQAPAPATVTKTVTVREPTPAPLPSECTDYIQQVDAAVQGVIDYDSSIAGVHAAEEAASLAIADHDQAALSEARSQLNHILNDSVGPLQDLYVAQAPLRQARDACDKALGG